MRRRARAGYVLFVREQTLFAQPFDPEELRVTGEAFLVAEQVGLDAGVAPGWVSATPQGTLAYRAAAGISGAPMWVNRAGVEVATIGAEIREPRNPRLSPDGKRLVLVAAGDVWEYDLQGRPPVKVTAEGGAASPLWTPDGKSLVYELGHQHRCESSPPQREQPPNQPRPMDTTIRMAGRLTGGNSSPYSSPAEKRVLTSSGSRPASNRRGSSL